MRIIAVFACLCVTDKSFCSGFMFVLLFWAQRPGLDRSEFLMWYPGNGQVSMAVTGLAGQIMVSQVFCFVFSFWSRLGPLQCGFQRNGVKMRWRPIVEEGGCRKQTVTQIHILRCIIWMEAEFRSKQSHDQRQQTGWVAALKRTALSVCRILSQGYVMCVCVHLYCIGRTDCYSRRSKHRQTVVCVIFPPFRILLLR